MVAFATPRPTEPRRLYVYDEDGVLCGSLTDNLAGGIVYDVDGVDLLKVYLAKDGLAAAALGPDGKAVMLMSVPLIGEPSVMDLRPVEEDQR
jgi:hypothetical protein